MRFKDFLNPRVQILNYAKKGYLHQCMEMPNDAKLCKQVFLARRKAHHIKYVEKHRVVESDILKLQEFFEGCHDADVHSGEYKYKRLVEGNMKTKQDGSSKKRNRCDHDSNCSAAALSIEIDKIRTGMIIDLMNDIIKRIVTIMIVIPCIEIVETTTVVVMTNLIVLIIGYMPRARTKAEIAIRVVIIPTM